MPPVTSEESTSYEVRMATTSETPYRVIVPALADRNLASFTGRGQQSQVTVGVPIGNRVGMHGYGFHRRLGRVLWSTRDLFRLWELAFGRVTFENHATCLQEDHGGASLTQYGAELSLSPEDTRYTCSPISMQCDKLFCGNGPFSHLP